MKSFPVPYFLAFTRLTNIFMIIDLYSRLYRCYSKLKLARN